MPSSESFWIRVLSQLVSFRHNPEVQKKLIERLDTKKCRDFRVFVLSVRVPVRYYKQPKFENGDRVPISKYYLFLRISCGPQFLRDFFEFVANFSRKPPTYPKKDELIEIIRAKNDQKGLIKVKKQWKSSPNSWFPMHLHNYFQTISQPFTNILREYLNLGGHCEVAVSGISNKAIYQKVKAGNFLFFDINFSNSSYFHYLEPGNYP